MTANHSLTAVGLGLAYGDRTVIDNLDLTVKPGAITSIVGANGCGKSTLLRSLARLLQPKHGQVLLDGKSLHEQPTKEIAKVLGLLPQSPTAPEGIVVADLIGRQPTTNKQQPTPGRFGVDPAASWPCRTVPAMQNRWVSWFSRQLSPSASRREHGKICHPYAILLSTFCQPFVSLFADAFNTANNLPTASYAVDRKSVV